MDFFRLQTLGMEVPRTWRPSKPTLLPLAFRRPVCSLVNTGKAYVEKEANSDIHAIVLQVFCQTERS